MAGYHKSVLLKESIDALMSCHYSYSEPPRRGLVGLDGWYLDSTLGDGGHTLEILKRGGNVISIDVDPTAIGQAKKRLEQFRGQERFGQYLLIRGNFRDVKNLIRQRTDIPVSKFAGAIFDLGVSGLQLETPLRGFSFAREGPLDMRMDPSLQVTALDLLNTLSRKELYELFLFLGEEKYSRRLADTLVSAREVAGYRKEGTGIRSTVELAKIVERAAGGRKKGQVHPATRVFQALRIAVNDELGALQEGLDQAKDLIGDDGRIVVISFHSLEDRIVKNIFKKWAAEGTGEIMTKKPLAPTKMEISENPKSRSAKMRVFKVT